MTTPAAPATPVVRRRRPRGLVIAAGVLLGTFGLLGLLIDADRGRGLSVAGLAAAGLLVLAAVGLLAAGRLGYWVGLAVAGLLAAVLALGWTRRPDAAGAVVVAVAAVPLVLLLLPQAHRPLRPRAEPAASGVAPAQHRTRLPRPQGWPPELAGGWIKFVLSGGVAVVLAGAGLAMLVAGPGSVRVGGAIVALFGLGVLGALPLLRPGGRRGHLRQETLQVGDRQQRGVAFPYSSRRTAVALVTVSSFAVAMLAMAVFAQLLVEPGESVWTPRIIGAAGLIPFAFVAYRAARRGFGRRWRLVLTPPAVVLAQGPATMVVPWGSIETVKALATTLWVRGGRIREPLVGLAVSDRGAVQGATTLDRAVMALDRTVGADISLPVRSLAVDPALLYHALRYYHQRPEARAELATEAGLERLRRGDLDGW
jgi:hypothetical protein